MRVGFIGVGQMGRHMAASLLKCGYQLLVHDRRRQVMDDEILDGASWSEDPGNLARNTDVVIMSLPGPEEVDEVVLGPSGVLEAAQPGDLLIDMSTSTPGSIRAIDRAAAEKSVLVVDAPVAGGIRGARKATLTIMVGGTDDAYNAAEPILRCMGDKIFHVGSVGSGHVAKLVNNMMTIVNGITAMEALAVGAKAGVDPEILLEVAQAGTGASFSLNVFPYVIFKRNFDPAKFALRLAAKDLRVSWEFAKEIGVPIEVVAKAAECLAQAVDDGMGDRDWSSYVTVLEQRSGVLVAPFTSPRTDHTDGST